MSISRRSRLFRLRERTPQPDGRIGGRRRELYGERWPQERKRADRQSIVPRYACMTPVITGIRPEPRSKSADHCWPVCYQFCGLSAEITVYAENEAEARVKAVDQLRLRGLRVT
jgi:hypothetical protein